MPGMAVAADSGAARLLFCRRSSKHQSLLLLNHQVFFKIPLLDAHESVGGQPARRPIGDTPVLDVDEAPPQWRTGGTVQPAVWHTCMALLLGDLRAITPQTLAKSARLDDAFCETLPLSTRVHRQAPLIPISINTSFSPIS